MAEKSSKLIGSMKYSEERSKRNKFDEHVRLFDFGIECDYTANDDKPIPRLSKIFHRSRVGLQYDLKDGMTEAIMRRRVITNHTNARIRLWIHFLRYLKRKNIVEKETFDERQVFVSLSSTIVDLFLVEGWQQKPDFIPTFFALKSNGVIYLFFRDSLEEEEEEEGQYKEHDFFLSKFNYLVTGRESDGLNGIEKCFRVNRIQLDYNKLIVCHPISAKDVDGFPVYTKCRQINGLKEKEYKYNLLRDWANCLVEDAQTFVLGKRFRSTLQEVQVMDRRRIPRECRAFWWESKCISFLDQSLEFIKRFVYCENKLYEFRIKPFDMSLECLTPNHFLPDFFVEQ